MDATTTARCRENLAAIQGRISEACRRAGRPVADVRLVGVTKYVDVARTRLLVECGCLDVAESRPQQVWSKAAALVEACPGIRWHLVGHLQRNKVRRTLPVVSLVQTVDSLRLLEALDEEATAACKPCDVLIEVNLSDDPGRSGVALAEVPAVVESAAARAGVRLRGLMGMARHPDSPSADARRDFGQLRELRDLLAADLPPGVLAELSMGMSGDFEEAIHEGATMVRIGSALFEGLAS